MEITANAINEKGWHDMILAAVRPLKRTPPPSVWPCSSLSFPHIHCDRPSLEHLRDALTRSTRDDSSLQHIRASSSVLLP
jgi:hypothetical protein